MLKYVPVFLLALSTNAFAQSFPSGSRLTCNATDASGTCNLVDAAGNGVILPNNTVYAMTVSVSAVDVNNSANYESWNEWLLLIKRGGSASATALQSGTKPTPLSGGTVTAADIAVGADTTNGGLILTYTSPSTVDAHVWHVAATAIITEVK